MLTVSTCVSISLVLVQNAYTFQYIHYYLILDPMNSWIMNLVDAHELCLLLLVSMHLWFT